MTNFLNKLRASWWTWMIMILLWIVFIAISFSGSSVIMNILKIVAVVGLAIGAPQARRKARARLTNTHSPM